MGHPAPFDLRYVTVGNEDCEKKLISIYKGSYHVFYDAIRNAYPDIQIISNCDASQKALDHPADLYDYHVRYNILTSQVICFIALLAFNPLTLCMLF